MQDRYAGDVGDFSKFALLRVLWREFSESIGIIWYRFPDEVHNNDGRHTDYLDDARWLVCDNDLVCKLREIVVSDNRNVRALESLGILPDKTKYFDEQIHPDSKSYLNRSDWFKTARTTVAGCDLVLVDPDNGIAGPNHRPTNLKGGKHITIEEIATLAADHSCVVVYHHFDRSSPHLEQAKSQLQRIRTASSGSHVYCVRYRRISPRAYFVITNSNANSAIERALGTFRTGAWAYHFEVFV